MEDLFKVLMESSILRDHQVIFENSLDKVLAVKKILELLEVNGILGTLRFEGVDESLQLVMAINTTLLDVVKKFMLKEITSAL